MPHAFWGTVDFESVYLPLVKSGFRFIAVSLGITRVECSTSNVESYVKFTTSIV